MSGLPEYPFEWDPDARFLFVVTLRNHLNGKGHGVDINVVDDAIEAAVKAYNAEVNTAPTGSSPVRSAVSESNRTTDAPGRRTE